MVRQVTFENATFFVPSDAVAIAVDRDGATYAYFWRPSVSNIYDCWKDRSGRDPVYVGKIMQGTDLVIEDWKKLCLILDSSE